MEILTGNKMNSSIYHDKTTHYLYKLRKSVVGKTYFACWKKGCHATAVFKDVCTVKKPHNHGPDLKDINRLRVMYRCKKRAMSENTPTKQIFQEEMAMITENIPNIKAEDIESCLMKCRKREQPINTESVTDFAMALQGSRYSKTTSNQPFFSVHQDLGNDCENIIFTSPTTVSNIDNGISVYADATFRSMPNQPKFKLLLVLHIDAFFYTFPVMYVLMTKDTEEAYFEVFKYFKQEILRDKNAIKFTTGFDIPMQRAVQRVFGNEHSQLYGYYFQFAEFIMREISDPRIMLKDHLNEDGLAKHFVGAVLSLPLLPVIRLHEGLNCLEHQFLSIQDPMIVPKVRSLLDHVHNYWVRQIGFQAIKEQWKYADNVDFFDAFPWNFKKLMGTVAYSNIWYFIDKLIKCDSIESEKYAKAAQGEQLSVDPKTKVIYKDRRIRQLLERMEKEKMSTQEFLQSVGQRILEIMDSNTFEEDEVAGKQAIMSPISKSNTPSTSSHIPTHSPHPNYSPEPTTLWGPQVMNIPIKMDHCSPYSNISHPPPMQEHHPTTPIPLQVNKSTMKSSTPVVNVLSCKLCHTNKLEMFFRPCGHIWTCSDCWSSIKASSLKPACPNCYKPVLEALRAYLE